MTGEVFQRLVAWVARRPAAVVGAVVVLAVAAGLFAALTLRPTAGTDTPVGRSSATFEATQRYHQRFGDDAVIVLVRGPLTKLVLTQDIGHVLGLEGCLSGNAPRNVKPLGGPNGPCATFARTKPVQVVYGPGTFINESVKQIGDEVSREQRSTARQSAQARGASPPLRPPPASSSTRASRRARRRRASPTCSRPRTPRSSRSGSSRRSARASASGRSRSCAARWRCPTGG